MQRKEMVMVSVSLPDWPNKDKKIEYDANMCNFLAIENDVYRLKKNAAAK
jgi:hypothetical protein